MNRNIWIVEPCADAFEALSLARLAWRNGLPLRIATPRTHGFWGVYLARPALPC